MSELQVTRFLSFFDKRTKIEEIESLSGQHVVTEIFSVLKNRPAFNRADKSEYVDLKIVDAGGSADHYDYTCQLKYNKGGKLVDEKMVMSFAYGNHIRLTGDVKNWMLADLKKITHAKESREEAVEREEKEGKRRAEIEAAQEIEAARKEAKRKRQEAELKKAQKKLDE